MEEACVESDKNIGEEDEWTDLTKEEDLEVELSH